jgi:hypothetical protein
MPLAIPSSLRLWVPNVHPSFKGSLYFIVGPGLGDTVNDFRILKEVLKIYADARAIVYLDSRWKELYEIVPELHRCLIRYYPPAPSGVLRGGEQSFHHTFGRILREIMNEIREGNAYVALGGFTCPDQLAKKESGLSVKARAIGLSLSHEQLRPYVPINNESRTQACGWLSSQGVQSRKYIVFCTQTQSDKLWSRNSWDYLLNELYKTTQLPLIVVGLQTENAPTNAFVKCALGLPLPVVAALLAEALCFIGLDSGLTHVAAGFNLPIVTLNSNGKFPPFVVEPASPSKWTILTPGIYGKTPISTQPVLISILRAIRRGFPPECPVCDCCPYVLGGVEGQLLLLCRCGLIRRLPERTQTMKGKKEKNELNNQFPIFLAQFSRFETILQQGGEGMHGKMEYFQFEHWDPIRSSEDEFLRDSTDREFWWTWDAAYQYLKKNGWTVASSTVKKTGQNSHAVFQVRIQAMPGVLSRSMDAHLKIPWGMCILSIPRSIYEQYLSWGTFRKQDNLEGLGWYLVKHGNGRLGRYLLLLAFRVYPRFKTLGRLLRSGAAYFNLFQKPHRIRAIS